MVRRLLTLLMLAGVLVAIPSSALAGPGDPDYNKPTEGECRNYGYQALGEPSESSAPVGCGQKHTAKVFKVFMLPTEYDWATVTDAQLQAVVAGKCRPAYQKWMGRKDTVIALTAYSYGWFTPSADEIAAGARWLRCDIVAYKSGALAPLTRNKIPMIPKPLTDSVRKCLNGANYFTTICTARHQYRATGSFALAKGRYPSATKFQRIAADRCPRLVTTRAYLYQYPSKAQWKSGYRVMVCYSKTTR